MFGIDKLKLILDIDDVEIIQEERFTKKLHEDELISLHYEQKQPFKLTINKNYRNREAFVEFTGKCLLSEYHNLIRLGNIHKCIENINSIGLCKIKHYMSAEVVVCDVTNDFHVVNIKELSIFLKNNLSSFSKYIPQKLPNGNFIVKKNVGTKRCEKVLTIYDKGKEMYLSKNKQFLEKYYNDVNPFVNKCRFELSLDSKKQIRDALHISNTTLKNVLLTAQSVNPILEFISDLLDKEVDNTTDVNSNENLIKQYEKFCTLKENNFDIEKLGAELDSRRSKNTRMSKLLKPYRKILKNLNNKPDGYTRETILQLITTETQITPKMIYDSI